MENNYIVRQPVLDMKKEVYAYDILWNDSFEEQKDLAAASAVENFISELNNERFLDGKVTFLTFTPNLLMRNVPKLFDAQKLVIQIDDSVVIHPLAQKVIYRFHKQGYRIAIKNFEFTPRYFRILEIVDFIKVDFSNMKNPSLKNIINFGTSMSKQIVAYNVDSPEAKDMAISLGCNYIQGASVAQQFTSKVNRMDHMQSNFFQLMVAITREEPDIDEIASIISRDVTLAFPLIKLVNSAYFALRNQVSSVKQALIVLGLGQLKEWVYLLSFKDGSNFPEELIRMSFLRAQFSSELSKAIPNFPIASSEVYLMGMFSTLGNLLDVPLESALSELALSQEVKNALLKGEGPCGILYNLVCAYERADWKGMSQLAGQLGVSVNVVSQKYFESVDKKE